MSTRPKALVLEAPGINCNEETAFAIEHAGGDAEQVHISQLRSGEKSMADYAILALSGGFSYGDSIRSGAILGLELRTRFADELNAFVENEKPVIGICNGLQTLVESGLLPNGSIAADQEKAASLIGNESGKFECRWVHLTAAKSACRFVIPSNSPLTLPVAHAEGRFVSPKKAIPQEQTVFTYTTDTGESPNYPSNPNGSPDNIAGITDPSGVILGMMPHPERFIQKNQHPNWRQKVVDRPFGAVLFENLVKYAKDL